jgi:hypothetical protein
MASLRPTPHVNAHHHRTHARTHGLAYLSWPLALGLVCAAETRLAEGNWGNEKSRGVEEEPALFVAEDDDDDEGEEASSMMSVGMENARPRSGGDSRCCA